MDLPRNSFTQLQPLGADWRQQSESALFDLVAQALASEQQPGHTLADVSMTSAPPLLMHPSLLQSSATRQASEGFLGLDTRRAPSLADVRPPADTLLGLPLDSLESLPTEVLEAHLLSLVQESERQQHQGLLHSGRGHSAIHDARFSSLQSLKPQLSSDHVPDQTDLLHILGGLSGLSASAETRGGQHAHEDSLLLKASQCNLVSSASGQRLSNELPVRGAFSADMANQRHCMRSASSAQLDPMNLVGGTSSAMTQLNAGMTWEEDDLESQLLGAFSHCSDLPAVGTPSGSFNKCFSEPIRDSPTSGSAGGKQVLSETDKRLRRLAGNREAARRMRKRQSERLKALEIEFAQLKKKHQETVKELTSAKKTIEELTQKNHKLEHTVAQLKGLAVSF